MFLHGPYSTPPPNDCQCGSDVYGIIRCNSETCDISVKNCYCITYSEALNKSFASYCFYSCFFTRFHTEYYHLDAKNISELNEATCGRFNRTGLMCGECIADHAPAVYSYDLACVECQDYKYNWLKYIAVAYVPLTVFYILIVAMRISVTSPAVVAYITVSQIFSAPGVLRVYFNGFIQGKLILKVFSSLYSIWNLDFFRGVYKPFCLHPDLSMLQVISLDYIVGVYPLVLIFITDCLVRLHDRYVVISKLWKPFFNIFSFLRREWNIRESLVNAFIVLSYVKIMNVSFDLLTPSHSYHKANGGFIIASHLFTALLWRGAYSLCHLCHFDVTCLQCLPTTFALSLSQCQITWAIGMSVHHCSLKLNMIRTCFIMHMYVILPLVVCHFIMNVAVLCGVSLYHEYCCVVWCVTLS